MATLHNFYFLWQSGPVFKMLTYLVFIVFMYYIVCLRFFFCHYLSRVFWLTCHTSFLHFCTCLQINCRFCQLLCLLCNENGQLANHLIPGFIWLMVSLLASPSYTFETTLFSLTFSFFSFFIPQQDRKYVPELQIIEISKAQDHIRLHTDLHQVINIPKSVRLPWPVDHVK